MSKFAISNDVRSSTLLINNAAGSDTGQYWCTAEFADLGTVRSLSATISLAGVLNKAVPLCGKNL